MKRSTLSCTIALLLATGQADAAVTLNPEGLGQGLLFPFFTTKNGQTTLLNIQNQSADAKALKVRIMEGHAGAETLTFNVYLGAHARWSAALALPDDSEDAPAALVGNGKGCAVPRLVAPKPLRTSEFDGDGGPSGPKRTRRGYVEVVEMGVLASTLAAAAAEASEVSCGQFVTRMATGGIWEAAPNADLVAPSGGLRGDAVVMDTHDGTSFGYPALAFNGLASAPRQFALTGANADPLSPRLTDIPGDAEGEIRVDVIDDDNTPFTLRYPAGRGYDAISALLASTATFGNYNIHPAVAA